MSGEHIPAVEPDSAVVNRAPVLLGYRGVCSCGWRGQRSSPKREGKASAQRSAITHAREANAKAPA